MGDILYIYFKLFKMEEPKDVFVEVMKVIIIGGIILYFVHAAIVFVNTSPRGELEDDYPYPTNCPGSWMVC
jgi:hypothetical protein